MLYSAFDTVLIFVLPLSLLWAKSNPQLIRSSHKRNSSIISVGVDDSRWAYTEGLLTAVATGVAAAVVVVVVVT